MNSRLDRKKDLKKTFQRKQFLIKNYTEIKRKLFLISSPNLK